MKVKIKGLNGHMKSKVKSHGDTWEMVTDSPSGDMSEIKIQTTKPVHAGGFPYMTWATPGRTIEVVQWLNDDGTDHNLSNWVGRTVNKMENGE